MDLHSLSKTDGKISYSYSQAAFCNMLLSCGPKDSNGV